MKNSSPGPSGSTEAATGTMTADTTPQADRHAELAPPDTTPNLPEAARQRGRRRTVIVAVVAILALLVAAVLVAVGSSKTEPPVVPLDSPAAGSYAGDWKDALIEQNGAPPYAGDWKDALIETYRGTGNPCTLRHETRGGFFEGLDPANRCPTPHGQPRTAGRLP